MCAQDGNGKNLRGQYAIAATGNRGVGKDTGENCAGLSLKARMMPTWQDPETQVAIQRWDHSCLKVSKGTVRLKVDSDLLFVKLLRCACGSKPKDRTHVMDKMSFV